LGGAHAAPQAPQWSAESASSTSQPSSARPSQSAKPAAQANPQVPRVASQVGAALGGTAQGRPHAPQLAVERSEVSQPLSARPSQSPKTLTQVPTAQAPPMHTALLCSRSQRMPQTPQFTELVPTSTQAPSQQSRPAAQGRAAEQPTAHDPPTQAPPAGQSASTRQSPQVWRTRSQRRGRGPASAPPGGAQSRSSRQPSWQVSVVASQKRRRGQVSGDVRQPTQRPVTTSQRARRGSAQSSFWTQRGGASTGGTSGVAASGASKASTASGASGASGESGASGASKASAVAASGAAASPPSTGAPKRTQPCESAAARSPARTTARVVDDETITDALHLSTRCPAAPGDRGRV
jgi:hypothetical protein